MIPTLPAFYNMHYTREDGTLTPDSYLYNDQTFQTLNLAMLLINSVVASTITPGSSGLLPSITPDAIIVPNKTTAQITALEPEAQNGSIWFNTTLSKLQVKTAAGVIETITSV